MELDAEKVKTVCGSGRTQAEMFEQFAAMKRAYASCPERIPPEQIARWADVDAMAAETIRNLVWCVEDLWQRLEASGK